MADCAHLTEYANSVEVRQAHSREADVLTQKIITLFVDNNPCDAVVTFTFARIIGTMVYTFPPNKRARVLSNFIRLCNSNADFVAEQAKKKQDTE